MRRLIVFLVVSFCIAGCTPKPTPAPKLTPPARPIAPRPVGDPAKLEDLVKKLNEFSLRLHTDVAKNRKGNLATSPIGSFLLMELLYEGSTGAAHDDLEPVLGRPEAGMSEVALLVWKLNQLPSTSLAHKIYVDQSAKVLDSYLKRIDPVMGEPVETVPLQGEPAVAMDTINKWVDEQTGGLIGDAVQSLDPETVSVLVSTLYFHGQWEREFPTSATKSADFTLRDGTTIKVPMMRLKEKWLPVLSVEGAKGVVLHYKDDTELVLLLPDKGHDPDQVLGPLIQSVEGGAAGGVVTLELPRFDFRVNALDMTKSLDTLGLKKVLRGADLSPMLEQPTDPFSSEVRQSTYIKVDEKGTTAAAVTTLMPSPASTMPPEPLLMRFDRPFAFLLRHSASGAILMLGRVERPEEWTGR